MNNFFRPLLAGLTLTAATVFSAQAQTLHIENPPPKAGFTDAKPAYMYFKDATLTKKGKHSFDVEVTLYGDIPDNLEDKIQYYIGFDIDSDKSTGAASATTPNFGQDIGAFIFKVPRTNRFDSGSNAVLYHGKTVDLNVGMLKVSKNQISFTLRSEPFGQSPAFKFFLSATRTQYDKNRVVSEVQVDTLPRKGVATFTADAK